MALIIGNSAYQHTPKLANPKYDATDMAAALKKLGFRVLDVGPPRPVTFNPPVGAWMGARDGAEN